MAYSFNEFDLIIPKISSLAVQRAVVVGLSQQTLDREQNRRDVVDSRPLFLQNVQANVPVLVDVGVENGGLKANGRRTEGVIRGEVEGHLEGKILVGGVLHSFDGARPVEEVVGAGEGRDALG